MGIWAWVILLVWSAALATAGQYLFFRQGRGPKDFDWVYIAGGALLGSFTAHVWYPISGFPLVDGLNLLQALVGGLIGAVAIELVYRFWIRRRVAV